MRRGLLAATAVAMLLGLVGTAHAFEDMVGLRPLSMGGAGRAFAVGDAGPLLNPSGMSLVKHYHVEGSYLYSTRRNDHLLHASIVDSTSAYLIAGGVYYTYHASSPDGRPTGAGHEGGVSLSLPFAEQFSLGGTLKYFRLSGDQAASGHDGGVTFDVGVTIRPLPVVSVAVVGMNLRNIESSEAPQGIGYGAAVVPMGGLVLAVDGVTPFTRDTYTGRKFTSLGAGGELILAQRFGVRLGGGYDGASGNVHLDAGFSLVSELGAVDVGARQDVSRHELDSGGASPRVTIVGIALRLFVPAVQSSSPP